VAEAEDALTTRRPHGVEVAADPEDVRSFLGRKRIVEGNAQGLVRGHAAKDPLQELPTKLIRMPRPPREEPVERFVMLAPGHAGHNEGLGDGMSPRSQDPADKDDEHVLEGWTRQGRPKDVQRVEQGSKQRPARDGLPILPHCDTTRRSLRRVNWPRRTAIPSSARLSNAA